MMSYDDILNKSPANLSPYLTGRGIGILCLCILSAILVAIFMIIEAEPLAEFFTAVTASLIFIIASIHGYLLIIWRSVYIQKIHFEVSIGASHLYPNSEFDIQYQIQNTLKFPILIEALRWDCSPQIEVLYEKEQSRMLAGQTCLKLVNRAKAVAVGKSAIFGYGVILTDPLHLLRAEIHTEVGYETEITPARVVQQKSELNLVPMMLRKQNRNSRMAMMIEPDCVRPYQHGDMAKRIIWRGFARRNELSVWEPEKLPPKKLVCFVDAGPRMRLGTAKKALDYQIVAIITQIALCAAEFDTVSVIAYHESGAEIVVKNQPVSQALELLDEWCLKILEWKMPTSKSSADMTRWSEAVRRLWKYFKVYKGVDFSQVQNNIRQINVRQLVDWARTDMMYTAIRQNDVARTRQIDDMSFLALAERLIRYWCRIPDNRLSPDGSVSMLKQGMELLKNLVNDDEISTLIWFSDFADDFSEKSLNFVIQLLSGSGMDAIGVVMKMPVHQLNFIAKLGAVCQARNYQKLSEVMSFVWMENPKQHIRIEKGSRFAGIF